MIRRPWRSYSAAVILRSALCFAFLVALLGAALSTTAIRAEGPASKEDSNRPYGVEAPPTVSCVAVLSHAPRHAPRALTLELILRPDRQLTTPLPRERASGLRIIRRLRSDAGRDP